MLRHQIDTIHHVNNGQYVQMAEEFLPENPQKAENTTIANTITVSRTTEKRREYYRLQGDCPA